MGKSFQTYYTGCIYITLVLSLVFSPILITANQCDCYFCEENAIEEPIDYESLGEFEEAFRQFEIESDAEDDLEDAQKKGFFKKWCKKLKNWFKKKTYKIFKKMVGLKKTRNSEECAYTIAKFKRKIDKKLYHTGSIDKMFSKFDEHTNDSSFVELDKFKERIKFYYKNKNEKPPTNTEKNSHNEVHEQLKDVPTRVLWGCTAIACGTIIRFLPFPGCSALGYTLIAHGTSQIYEGYMNRYEEDHKNDKISNRDDVV